MITQKSLSIALASCFAATAVWADEPAPTTVSAPVVVTATRVEQNSFDLPVSIDVVELDKIQDAQVQMTLSESLIRVPGVTAQFRNQLAQDPQISSRGFGSRSAFGVRGLRVYVDGIPLSMPDGGGQPGVVDLALIKSVEVMRGPFSSLYGSSSGGVINMLSEDAPKTPKLSATAMFGSDDTRRDIVKAGGSSESGDLQYLAELSHFESDGYRLHSASKKDMATVKIKFAPTESTTITALINWIDQPWTQDPLGLDRTAALSNPKSVTSGAITNDTKVTRDHRQVGVSLEHALDGNNSINLMAYGGTRSNLQYISKGGTGTAAAIQREFGGVDGRWTNKGQLLEKPYSLSLGVTYGHMRDARTDRNTLNAIVGALARDEDDIAWNFDQYAQASWSPSSMIDLHAGVRHTLVKLEIKDHFGAVDDGGHVFHEKTMPVAGVVFKANDSLNLYANAGRGFENPTLVEVGLRSLSPDIGPNLGVKPSVSRNYEVGAKAWLGSSTLMNLALFKTYTQDEIVMSSQVGSRAVYTNADKTERQGVEFSVDSKLPENVNLYAAYTLLDATFESPYAYTVSGVTKRVAAGNKIPGTYRTQLYGEAAWKYPAFGFSTAIEGRYNSAAYVNDSNSEKTPSYTIFNLRAGFEQAYKGWQFKEFARVENLFDRSYIGSIRVNDANDRYYEPSAGRNWLFGLNASYQF